MVPSPSSLPPAPGRPRLRLSTHHKARRVRDCARGGGNHSAHLWAVRRRRESRGYSGWAQSRSSRGAAWNASTINGNSKRAYGRLHNTLYVGRPIWNKSRTSRRSRHWTTCEPSEPRKANGFVLRVDTCGSCPTICSPPLRPRKLVGSILAQRRRGSRRGCCPASPLRRVRQRHVDQGSRPQSDPYYLHQNEGERRV
jgi:hypothetical protein